MQFRRRRQVDPPHELYNLPNNIFVGGFIGSPAMNFFDVTLVAEDGAFYADGGSFRLQVPAERKASLEDYVGKQLVLGVRPEDLHDKDYAPPLRNSTELTVDVDVLELMGNEIFLYLLIGERSFIARVDPRSKARVGDKVDVLVNLDTVHLFDRDTEKAIR